MKTIKRELNVNGDIGEEEDKEVMYDGTEDVSYIQVNYQNQSLIRTTRIIQTSLTEAKTWKIPSIMCILRSNKETFLKFYKKRALADTMLFKKTVIRTLREQPGRNDAAIDGESKKSANDINTKVNGMLMSHGFEGIYV